MQSDLDPNLPALVEQDSINDLAVGDVIDVEFDVLPERQIGQTDDGYLYDIATGEVLGMVDLAEHFEVRDTFSANWTLEKKAELEAEMLAITARMDALVENLEKQRQATRRKLSWWDRRFRPSLVEWARGQLKGKSKTVQLDQGKVAFRATKGTTTIVSNELAIKFARTWRPESIKVKESINVTDALLAVKAAEKALKEEVRPEWIVSSGPGESILVSTGIDVKGGVI